LTLRNRSIKIKLLAIKKPESLYHFREITWDKIDKGDVSIDGGPMRCPVSMYGGPMRWPVSMDRRSASKKDCCLATEDASIFHK